MAITSQSSPFIKQLAANDRQTRDKAVDSLRTYLGGRTYFEEIELLKLWKGLFYCMWMSDRPRTQQQLAVDLAGLVDILSRETVIPFLDAFWKMMAREWNGIDVLRMDKFLFLVRQYLAASFRQFVRQGWRDTDMIGAYMDVLAATPLNPSDNKIPNGMRYHVIDIYVDELDKVDQDREGKLPLERVLRPLVDLGKHSPTKSIRTRVKEALDDDRLKDWTAGRDGHEKPARPGASSGSDEEGDDDDDEWGGIED